MGGWVEEVAVLVMEITGGNVAVDVVEIIDAVGSSDVLDVNTGEEVLEVVETVENSEVVGVTVVEVVSST